MQLVGYKFEIRKTGDAFQDELIDLLIYEYGPDETTAIEDQGWTELNLLFGEEEGTPTEEVLQAMVERLAEKYDCEVFGRFATLEFSGPPKKRDDDKLGGNSKG